MHLPLDYFQTTVGKLIQKSFYRKIFPNHPQDHVITSNNIPLFSEGLYASIAEKRLLENLFHPDNHDINVRPVKNHNDSLNVSLTLSLYQLIEIVRCSES